jgi:hypothetical protein
LATAFLIAGLSLLAAGIAAQPVTAALTPELPADLVEIESEDEGEETEEELEVGEEEEFEVAAGTAYLPAECLLRSAEPTVVAQGHNLRLTLRYTADSPTKVGVGSWLKGGKGSLQLGSVTRHISNHGVLRINHHLSDREAIKVRAAHAFVVDINVPEASPECKRYLTLRLTTKHLRAGRATWSE